MDSHHYIPRLLLLPALVVMLGSGPVMAGAITNLTDTPRLLEIRTSSGYVGEMVPPGATRYIHGDTHVRFNEKEFYLQDDMEYALWQDGSFGPQRRLKNRRH